LDCHTERGRAHRTRSLEALDRLDEAPRRDGAHLDVGWIDERVATDDAPAIVERLDHRDLLSERDHELVGQDGGEQLADLTALDTAQHARHGAECGRRHRRGTVHANAEKRGSPRAWRARRGAQEGDGRGRPPRRAVGRGRRHQGAAAAAGRHGEWTRHGSARDVMLQDFVLGRIGSDDSLLWKDDRTCQLVPGKVRCTLDSDSVAERTRKYRRSFLNCKNASLQEGGRAWDAGMLSRRSLAQQSRRECDFSLYRCVHLATGRHRKLWSQRVRFHR
jgi:hypothetical protein